MPPDLLDDVERLRSHIPCLEAAAADESAHPVVRAYMRLEADLTRAAVDLAAQTVSQRDGTPSNETKRLEVTEVTPHGHA